MEAPGIDVRPMVQITGHAEFCEIFLDDVVVPHENLLGERGQGWKIAMHVVAHERGTAAVPRQVTLRTWLDRLVADAAAPLATAAARRRASQAALAGRSSRSRCCGTTRSRTMSPFLNGGAVGPESSTVKLLMAQAEQTLGEAALEVLGDAGAAASGTSAISTRVPPLSTAARSRSSATIIADRILALPKE